MIQLVMHSPSSNSAAQRRSTRTSVRHCSCALQFLTPISRATRMFLQRLLQGFQVVQVWSFQPFLLKLCSLRPGTVLFPALSAEISDALGCWLLNFRRFFPASAPSRLVLQLHPKQLTCFVLALSPFFRLLVSFTLLLPTWAETFILRAPLYLLDFFPSHLGSIHGAVSDLQKRHAASYVLQAPFYAEL